MPSERDGLSERTSLLHSSPPLHPRLNSLLHADAISLTESHVSKDERALRYSTVGERLPYNDYTTIDWMHDLVKDSYRYRSLHARKGLRHRAYALFDASSGWIAVALIGAFTACVACAVDVAEATVNGWKLGYCKDNPFLTRDACIAFHTWSDHFWTSFAIYLGLALVFGVSAAALTLLTRTSLPAVAPDPASRFDDDAAGQCQPRPTGKVMYMAAGSGIPEIKTILSGFVIPGFLDLRVLIVKAVGATFAVASGMCLGKEGPFVHISACVGYLVASRFPKYRENGRSMREILSAAVAAGLSVAFGTPIGGVLFAYEEISTYFPRKVLWRAFLCSLVAAVVLKALNPFGTGKLVLFETNYGTSYQPQHYLIFVVLGIAGGLFGGVFCKLNYKWSKWFRVFPIIRQHPVLEVALVVLVTTLIQFPHPFLGEPGDALIKSLLVNCDDSRTNPTVADSFVCQNETGTGSNWGYIGALVYGIAAKLALTTVTFGARVPSGVIIPSLGAGALFGRLMGQWIGTISPGIFAMVGAAAFLAGVSRMTISLGVIMFELTGELEYIVPHMVAILVAKWVADSLSRESVYDLAQTVLGHPFLDLDHAVHLVQAQRPAHLLGRLIPPEHTMDEITVVVDTDHCVSCTTLEEKLYRLHERGLTDAGVVLVQNGILQGYLGEAELAFGLHDLGRLHARTCRVRLLSEHDPHHYEEDEDGVDDGPGWSRDGYGVVHFTPDATKAASAAAAPPADLNLLDLSSFVDRAPVSLSATAPMEYVVECFGKLGLRHLMVLEEGTGKLAGVVIKKRLMKYLSELQ